MSTDQAGTNASTDSGQGTAPLSDAFITVLAGKRSRRGQSQLVEAPEGSARLSVWRSSRMASSKSQPLQANSSAQDIIEAPPGVKRKPGYIYQKLPPVSEEPGCLLRLRVHMGMRVAFGTPLYPSWTLWPAYRLL